jgi:hypothetical protein
MFWMVSSIGKSWSLIFPEWLGSWADDFLESLDGASVGMTVLHATSVSVCDRLGEKPAPLLHLAATLPENYVLVWVGISLRNTINMLAGQGLY